MPRRPAARHAGALLALSAGLGGLPCQAALERLDLSLGALQGPGWTVTDLRVRRDLDPGGGPHALALQAARLELPEAGLAVEQLEARCPRLQPQDGGMRCADGEILALLPELGRRRAGLALNYRPAPGRLDFRLFDPLPRATGLASVYPNPFNPQTTIVFELAQPERTELAIYNLQGSLVRTLVSETRPGGRHEVVWNGKDNNGQQVASGVYMARLKAGSVAQMRKLVLVK